MTPLCVFVREGNIINYTNTTENVINPGDPVPMAAAFGVAVVGIAPGETGAVAVRGVFLGPADQTVAFNQGDKLYWDPVNKFFTTNATDTDLAGWADVAKAVGIGRAFVKLNY